jgi:hypothetical protein
MPAGKLETKDNAKENEGLLAGSNGHHAEGKLCARSIDIGVRGCFFWLSEGAAHSMSREERIQWMEASGKGECQDAAVSTEAFNGLHGTAFAGIARDSHSLRLPLLVTDMHE